MFELKILENFNVSSMCFLRFEWYYIVSIGFRCFHTGSRYCYLRVV